MSNRVANSPTMSRNRTVLVSLFAYVISDQPRVQIEPVDVPPLVEALADVPLVTDRLPEVPRSPETPPPRRFLS